MVKGVKLGVKIRRYRKKVAFFLNIHISYSYKCMLRPLLNHHYMKDRKKYKGFLKLNVFKHDEKNLHIINFFKIAFDINIYISYC